MRSLEDHLSPQELASLPESPETLASGSPEQQLLSQHLRQCRECSDLALTYWNLRVLHRGTASASRDEICPSPTAWLEFAAGLGSGQSASLLAHAAGCSACAIKLQEAMELMQVDQLDTAGEATETIEDLASATPAWQHRVAAQMVSASSVTPTTAMPLNMMQRLRHQPTWMTLSAAAIALCAIVLTGAVLWRTVHPSEARLLALAYNKQRTLALRIPGADPAPIASDIRGSATALTDPTELLELRLRAQQHLDQIPNSPYWHQVMGEVQLLEQDGAAARRSFEIAQSGNPDLPNLKLDLAAAWFEIGDKTGSAEAYAEAAELYSELLQTDAGDKGLLYYNRALCWERQNHNETAIRDLRAALEFERSTAWRRAIEAEIQRLSAHNVTQVPDEFESSLANATANLLPHWSDSSDARNQLLHIAALGRRHHDFWLQDWIAASHSSIVASADRHLAAAVSAATAGEAETSLVESRLAMASYVSANQHPGLLRAQVAELYAFQRLGRAKDCLETAAQVKRWPRLQAYARLRARVLLDEGICQGRIGNLEEAKRTLQQADSLTEASDLFLLRMSVISAEASFLDEEGMALAAWQLDTLGLKVCNQRLCPPMPQYQLLYNEVTGAQRLGLPYVAVEIMRTASHLAAATGDETVRAYALETLGTLLGRTGDYSGSGEAFSAASGLARSGGQGAMAKIYQADWQTDRAEIMSRRGSQQAALSLLEQSGPILVKSDYQQGRIHYFTQLASVQRFLGRYDDALDNGWAAVRESENSLLSLRSATERDDWQRENVAAYQELVEVYLQHGDATSALQVWERFRRAPYTVASAPVTPDDALESSNGHAGGVSADTRVLVFAHIGETYVGWLASVQPLRVLHTVVLGDQAHLQQSATTFYRLCADPHSNLDDVKSVGSRLYSSLLEPFGSQLQSLTQLWIDADPSLAVLPFSALALPDGRWLGQSSQLAMLPAWWTLRSASAFDDPPVPVGIHMVVVTSLGAPHNGDSEAAEIAKLFPGSTLLEGSSTSQSTILASLESADIFHFGGHATSALAPRLLLNAVGEDSLEGLTAESLRSVHLRRCRIAVLAACNTTASDPDQIEKLPDMRNAFLLSGANAVVASNWDVDDRSTHALMLAFYRQLHQGFSSTSALQAAQQSIRSTGGWQHPYYWSAFEVFHR